MSDPTVLAPDLASQYRAIYISQFKSAVREGRKIPFIFHLSILGFHLIPTLYLAIPHTRRPWLYRARWLVLSLTIVWHVWMVRHMSSANFAFAYGAGLVGGWGILSNLTLLVWTKPQWDAKRVEKIKNPRFRKSYNKGKPSAVTTTNTTSQRDNKSLEVSRGGPKLGSMPAFANGRINGAPPTALLPRPRTNGHATSEHTTNGHATNGHAVAGLRGRQMAKDGQPMYWLEGDRTTSSTALETVWERRNGKPGSTESDIQTQSLKMAEEFIYEWQSYPENAHFLTRLDWAFDIATTLRFTGWNWAIPVLPPYRPPPWLGDEKEYQLPLESLGNTSPQGYRRCRNRGELLRDRLLFSIVPSYIIMDLGATYLLQDPYFVLGPNDLPLPSHLASLPPPVLFLGRNFCAFITLFVGLQAAWDFGALLLAFLAPPILSFRVDPWHLPTMCGSFTNIMDRGLTGFWGAWWHQTFRFGFAAPTKWLLQNGYLKRGTIWASIVGAMIAFLQSGFVHAMASLTAMPSSRPWEPFIFFLLAGIGAQLQFVMSRGFKGQIEQMPRWFRRTMNLAFVTFWFQLTCRFILDDFTRNGIFLWEPVPFSIIRWLGFGNAGESWWRWDGDLLPRWCVGDHFWNTGIGA